MKTVLAGLVAATALVSAAQAQQQIVVAHAISPTSHFGLGADAFIQTLTELSGGAFTGEQAPNSQLGGERDMIEGLQIGSIDVVITSSGPLGNFVPEVLVLDLPFLFRDYDHARTTLDGEIGRELLDRVDENDLVGLAWSDHGFRHLTNSQRPVATPEDLAGLKLRTMENRVHMEAFSGLGAAPTPMAWPEVFTSLQLGVIDGQENPMPVLTSTGIWEVQQYVSLTGHVYSPGIILASPFLWDGLSEEERGWFLEAARAGVQATRDEVDRMEAAVVEMLRENGMTVITDIDRAPFAAVAAEAAYHIFTDRFGNELVERIIAVE